MAENKKITLHPLKKDGTIDININLYPRTTAESIVNKDGELITIATKDELDEEVLRAKAVENALSESLEKTVTLDTYQTITGGKIFDGYVKFNGAGHGAVQSVDGYVAPSFVIQDSSRNAYQIYADNSTHTLKFDIPAIDPDTDIGGIITFPRKSGVVVLDNDLATKADKVTLDSLVYDEEEASVTFPQGVRPLAFIADGDYYYVDYSNGVLVDADGQTVEYSDVVVENQQVTFNNFSLGTIEGFEYINFVNSSLASLNGYYLYNPITQSGTKLYKHTVVLSSNDIAITKQISFDITSLSDTACTNLAKVYNLFYNLISCNNIIYSTGNRLALISPPAGLSPFNISGLELDLANVVTFTNCEFVSDTVIAL